MLGRAHHMLRPCPDLIYGLLDIRYVNLSVFRQAGL